ncbi:hypothetical protein RFI_05007 [Reticulomyxa filosa]|uniref:Uncharacterized protein n=1 Tax=Reticulomyxa filosa TaxID=46433 RepID=X6P1H8_RETFI|nr:hypothetical protein RFI_05007 [Reticulomyxa filosa]|eukprot:ETO32111.1 hypothetical protein RFI_05007 [Reticulomyxa filosa]
MTCLDALHLSPREKNKFEYGVCYIFIFYFLFFFDKLILFVFSLTASTSLFKKKFCISKSPLTTKKNFGVEATQHYKKNERACPHQQKILFVPTHYKRKIYRRLELELLAPNQKFEKDQENIVKAKNVEKRKKNTSEKKIKKIKKDKKDKKDKKEKKSVRRHWQYYVFVVGQLWRPKNVYYFIYNWSSTEVSGIEANEDENESNDILSLKNLTWPSGNVRGEKYLIPEGYGCCVNVMKNGTKTQKKSHQNRRQAACSNQSIDVLIGSFYGKRIPDKSEPDAIGQLVSTRGTLPLAKAGFSVRPERIYMVIVVSNDGNL